MSEHRVEENNDRPPTLDRSLPPGALEFYRALLDRPEASEDTINAAIDAALERMGAVGATMVAVTEDGTLKHAVRWPEPEYDEVAGRALGTILMGIRLVQRQE